MNNHTPGPWKWRNLKGSTTKCELVGADGSVIYVAESGDGGVPADDDLVSTAPELLEALIWMVENDETNEGDEPLPDHNGATWNEINSYWISGLNRARAAIAKATREQP